MVRIIKKRVKNITLWKTPIICARHHPILVRHTYYLTDDVVDDAFSDMLRQAMLLAEVLHEKTLLLAAALPRRSREAVDIMVIISRRFWEEMRDARCEMWNSLLSLVFDLSSPYRRAVADKIDQKIQINHEMRLTAIYC